MRIWRNRKRAENNHCCAEMGQKTLDWTRKCVIRWFYRQSEFKLVVTKAQMTDNFMWLTNCTKIGRHFYPQSTPSHPWQRTGIWSPSGWHNDYRVKDVTKSLSIEMRYKIVGTDWIVAVNSKFRKARYALCFQINLDIRGNLSKMGKTFSENKIHRSNLAFWGLFCQSLGERWFHKKKQAMQFIMPRVEGSDAINSQLSAFCGGL